MSISLTPEFHRWVRDKLATGAYKSEEDVLQAARRALDAQEQTIAAIAEGYADFEEGRYRSFDEADTEFCRRHGLAEN